MPPDDDEELVPFDQGLPFGLGSGVKIDLAVIERGASIGCTKEELARLCGVVESTFYKRGTEDPGIEDAINRGAAMFVRHCAGRNGRSPSRTTTPDNADLARQAASGQQDAPTLTADLNIHRVLSEAPLTIDEWTALNVPDQIEG